MAKTAKKKTEITIVTTENEKPFTAARKWTELVAKVIEKSEKNAKIYICSDEVERDIRQGAYIYDYAYASDSRHIYLIDACSSYDDRSKANQLVERFLEMYPTPLILKKDMQFLVKLLAKKLKECTA